MWTYQRNMHTHMREDGFSRVNVAKQLYSGVLYSCFITGPPTHSVGGQTIINGR